MNKQEVALAVAEVLGVPRRAAWFSTGGKVTYFFQQDIAESVGVPFDGLTKVQHMRAILESVAVLWDEVRHSSEDTANPGSNVTREAYEDLLDALVTLIQEDQGPLERAVVPEYVQRSIRRRRGQASFRAALLEAYEARCAVTGSEAIAVLEAAHITPFAEGGIPQARNGLLLRSDIHTLFDLRLISVDPSTWRVVVDPSLTGTEYGDLHGVLIARPARPLDRPDRAAIQDHFDRSGILA